MEGMSRVTVPAVLVLATHEVQTVAEVQVIHPIGHFTHSPLLAKYPGMHEQTVPERAALSTHSVHVAGVVASQTLQRLAVQGLQVFYVASS